MTCPGILSHLSPSMETPGQFPVFFEVSSAVDAGQLRRIRNYFTIRRKSGGGECGSVTHVRDKLHCVFFTERAAQQRVLQKREHVLDFAAGPVVLTVQERPEPQGSSPSAAAPGQAPQEVSSAAGAAPPAGEECELRPDAYVLRYLKECPQAWEELEAELASLHCTGQLFAEEGRVLFRRSAPPVPPAAGGGAWRAQLQQLLDGYHCHFELQPLRAKALLQSCRSRHAANGVMVFAEVGYAVVVGKRSQVDARLKEVEDSAGKCRRSGEKQTSRRQFSEAKLRLLWRDIEDGLRQSFPGVKGSRGGAGQVVLEGSVDDLLRAGAWISEVEKQVAERRVSNLSPQLVSFIRTAYGGPGELGCFLGAGEEVQVEFGDTELRFFSLSPDQLDHPANQTLDSFKEVSMELPLDTAPLELQEALRAKAGELNRGQRRAQVAFGPGSRVCLLGHSREVAQLEEAVAQLVLDQSSTEGAVPLRFPELLRLLPELLRLHAIDCDGVSLHPRTSASGPVVALQGRSSKVAEVRSRLGPFLNSLVQGGVTIDLPGAARYFESPSGRENMAQAARTLKCVIQLQAQPPSAATASGVAAASYTCGGLQVEVCQGDITTVVADALVNAANQELDHAGGVAAALSRAGGPEVQRESRKLVKQIRKVPTGKAVMTTGGNLPCKALLHAVGPVAGRVGGRERPLLEQTALAALNLAETLELRSVAMPCISSGIYGVPVGVCADAIATAVKRFASQGGRSVSRVVLIDNRAEVVRALQDACDHLLQRAGLPPDLRQQVDAAGGGATAGGGAVTVELVQGTIETQQVDVLVSPMAGHDPLSTRVGHSLYDVVGPQLTAQFSQQAGGATPPGDIVLLEGPSPPGSKAVVFLSLVPWDQQQHGASVQVLRRGIRNVLASCVARGFCSVAVPVLGTGAVLRVPHSLASRVLLEEVLAFEQSRAGTSSFLLRVVVHPTDKESSKAFQSAQETLHVRGFRNDSDPDRASFYRHVSGTDGEVTATLGGVTLQMVLGNIVTAGTDVIVNTTDFKTRSSVSDAILAAAGPHVQAQFAQGTPAELLCSTGAGLLGCREIVHADFKKDPELIQKNCRKILKQCESKGYKSVAFPAINTGMAGMDSATAAKAMLDGMAAAVRDLKPNSLSLVRIVVLQTHVFQAFRSELESRFGRSCPRLSLRESAKQKLKKLLDKCSRGFKSAVPQTTFLATKSQPAALSIICAAPDVLDAVRRRLEDGLRRQLVEREVSVHEVSALSDMELEAVLAKVRGLGISVELRGSGEAAYVLRGLKEDVLSVTELVNRAVHDALREDVQDKKEALVALHVQWAIQDAQEAWQELSLHCNFVLEDAHASGQVFAEVTAPDSAALRANLQALQATDQRTGATFRLRRSVSGADLELPPHWEPMGADVFRKVELQPGSQEHQEVAQGFLRTAKFAIRKIERVQNLYLWHAYSVCRQRIHVKNNTDAGERSLYHGTSAAACSCIEKDRFDRNYAGTHAALHGKGVYFAVDASYSANRFSPPDAAGLRRLYVARVLTGRYTVGKADMKAPPPRGTDPTDCYDSLVDNQQRPTMFVVFHDDQAYPEYLITFA